MKNVYPQAASFQTSFKTNIPDLKVRRRMDVGKTSLQVFFRDIQAHMCPGTVTFTTSDIDVRCWFLLEVSGMFVQGLYVLDECQPTKNV